jgi:hypothetical protein
MKTASVAVGVETVRLALEAWRGRRRRGERIPEAVWEKASQAARRYGVNQVSRALGLDYSHLKRRTRGGEAAAVTPSRFLELSGGLAGVGGRSEGGLACIVELEKGNGTRLRLSVREGTNVDWAQVKDAFLEA